MTRATPVPGQELQSVLRKVLRHKVLVSVSLLVGIGTAVLIRDLTVPRYVAEAQVVLGPRDAPIVKPDPTVANTFSQPGVLHTQIDIILSSTMAENVARRLSKDDRRDLAAALSIASPYQRVTEWILGTLEALRAETLGERAAAEKNVMADDATSPDDELTYAVMRGISANNDGESYTIHIQYAAPNAQLAARLANLYADAYIQSQLDAKADAAARASTWLSARLVELRGTLETSETAVQSFRHAADILQDKMGTVTDQQLGQINSQLVLARSTRLDLESQYSTLQSIISSGGDAASLPDVLASPVIAGLKAREAELQRKMSANQSKFTDLYPADQNVATELASVEQQIETEVNRVAQSLAHKLESARNKEASLEAELARLKQRFGEGSDAEVQLRLLERESDANRAVYEAYLSRLKETTEQGKLQEPNAYLISAAVAPDRPTYPRSVPLLVMGALFGGLAGVAIALFREMLENRLHSIRDVEELTGLRVLGLVPSLPYARLFRPEKYVLRRPQSLFNEAIRTTRAAVALSGRSDGSKTLLVMSSIPGEGKTTYCLSLTRSLAADHYKVLLIDADLRRPGVGRALGDGGRATLSDYLAGRTEWRESLQVDHHSGAHYIVAGDNAANPQGLLGSERMATLLDQARLEYDAIIIDAPPILVVADAALIARWVDHCLLFVRWGSTAREYVEHALRKLDLYKVVVSGVVLNRVNIRRHANFAIGEGYYRSYAIARRRMRFPWAGRSRKALPLPSPAKELTLS
jgi:capsular exopolysaccharide synthesis family protein